ncbi:MAG TPA: hypothetical protein VFN88_06565 [Caulobacteraceae bacterium]|nr:hypothetical protein [Caulobacteraceae bacterium]
MSAAEAASPQAAEPTQAAFSRGTAIALVLAGIFSFSALAVLASFAPDLRTGGDPGAHALSKSAVGFGGLVKLLQLEGKSVVVSRSKVAPANPEALRVLTPPAGADASDIAPLTGGPTLVILPKWIVSGDSRNPDWVTRFAPLPADAILKGPLGILKSPSLSRRRGAGLIPLHLAQTSETLGEARIEDLQTIAATDLAPVVVDDVGDVVLGVRREPGRQDVYVLADPDLLDTYGLRELGGARLGRAVLDQARPGPGPIFFDVTLNGYERGRNLWKLAFQPPFLAATLCVLFAAILMGLQAAVRFGAERRAERAIGLGKQALADNQAGLIRMAKREPRMAEPYLKLIRDRTARIVGAGSVSDEGKLEALLDRLGARRTDVKISELSQEARNVADPAALVRLARRLHQWKLEISRERQ